MPTRCARCGTFAGRGREMPLPAEWLSYLRRERDVSEPVGTLKLPLCADCYADVQEVRERDDPDAREDLLDAIEPSRLIDEH